ncbi:MAG: RagB/SusD family nutrient uptake outer membrane protein [Bacteroidales bacterium]|nr:RagB/SusD family nutrient uptake outer membrane protein [Bacteroidales bacterium]
MKAFKIFSLILILGFASCSDFLEEDFRGGVAVPTWYTTNDGMEGLVASCYATSKIWFAKEEGYDFSVPGTDIYDYGQQHPQQYQYTYTTDFNPTNSRLVVLWIELYKGINACNDAIDVLSDPDLTPFDETKTAIRLSEVRFLRALYNWLIVEQWGGVQLRTEPIVGVVKTATRSSEEEFYKLILEDLDYAVEHLGADPAVNTSNDEYGRVNVWAARALRARMRLTWASYTGDMALYAGAAEDAAAVINSGEFSLYDNYADVWDIDNRDNNTENVWAINYSRTEYAKMGVNAETYTKYQRPADKAWDEREGGHHGHLMFGSQYDVQPGMQRDVENGRPFRRYSPTKYLIDCFHEDVDERFFGSFKTTWTVNATSIPGWFASESDLQTKEIKANTADPDTVVKMFIRTALSGKTYYLDSAMIIGTDTILTPNSPYMDKNKGKLVGKPLFNAIGDTCIHYVKGSLPDDIQLTDIRGHYMWNFERSYWCLDYENMFHADGTLNDEGVYDRNIFFELHKFYDNTRPAATDAGSMNGIRDAMVIRISEMYLIAAEALWKSGQAGTAYSQYLIPLADKRSYDGNGAAMLASYGINSGNDLSMEYFMDERAREFCGEQLRWFDLKRLGKDAMVARIKQYAGNPSARNNFDAHFTVRPIPQVQLDAITNKEEFLQNPGY